MPGSNQKLTPSQTYAKSLYPLRHGCPLYILESNEELSAEYLENGVQPGDLGVVRPDGGFDFLLSVVRPAGHPINKFGVPDGFEMVDGLIHSRKISNVFPAGQPILSAGGKSESLSTGVSISAGSASLGVEYSISFTHDEGAIVFPLEGVDSIDCGSISALHRYAEKHAESIYRWVNQTLGLDVENGDIYLVTGADKTSRWRNGVFSNSSSEGKCEFTVSSDPLLSGALGASGLCRFGLSSSSQHDWFFSRASPEDNSQKNQTLFLRGFRISLFGKFWSRRKLGVALRDVTSFKTWERLVEKRRRVVPFKGSTSGSLTSSSAGTPSQCSTPNEQSDGSCSPLESPGAGSDTSSEDHDFEARPEIFHPLKAINEYIAETRDDVQVVVTHDNDWISLLDEEDVDLPDDATFIRRLESRVIVEVNDGLASVVARFPVEEEAEEAEEEEFIKRHGLVGTSPPPTYTGPAFHILDWGTPSSSSSSSSTPFSSSSTPSSSSNYSVVKGTNLPVRGNVAVQYNYLPSQRGERDDAAQAEDKTNRPTRTAAIKKTLSSLKGIFRAGKTYFQK